VNGAQSAQKDWHAVEDCKRKRVVTIRVKKEMAEDSAWSTTTIVEGQVKGRNKAKPASAHGTVRHGVDSIET
jgi:hypothetical protein